MAGRRPITIEQPNSHPTSVDPLEVNVRLYRQISCLLDQLEDEGVHVTLKERIAGLIAVARIQTVFVALRKEKMLDVNSGSSVRKYEKAFKTHDARGRAQIAGKPAEPDADDAAIESVLDDAWGADDDERELA